MFIDKKVIRKVESPLKVDSRRRTAKDYLRRKCPPMADCSRKFAKVANEKDV